MTTQTLTPVQDVADGTGIDLSAQMVSATGTTLSFPNTGRERLLVANTGSVATVTVNIGSTVLGQSVTAFPAVTLSTANHIYQFGPFHSVDDVVGTSNVTVTLSTTTGTTVALMQGIGVF